MGFHGLAWDIISGRLERLPWTWVAERPQRGIVAGRRPSARSTALSAKTYCGPTGFGPLLVLVLCPPGGSGVGREGVRRGGPAEKLNVVCCGGPGLEYLEWRVFWGWVSGKGGSKVERSSVGRSSVERTNMEWSSVAALNFTCFLFFRVDITHQHSTHNQHIAHISRTVLSTSVVVSVLIVSQRSCSSSGRTVLHGLHAYLWLKKKSTFTW